MAVYAISGIAMIFWNDDTFKIISEVETTLPLNLDESAMGKALKIKRLTVERLEGDQLIFKEGTYNQATGKTVYLKKELPYILDKMEHLNKATTKSTIYWLNIFFGVSLLFFVISSFWMFCRTPLFLKKGFTLL